MKQQHEHSAFHGTNMLTNEYIIKHDVIINYTVTKFALMICCFITVYYNKFIPPLEIFRNRVSNFLFQIVISKTHQMVLDRIST